MEGALPAQQSSNFGWMFLPPDGHNYCKCRGGMPGSLDRPFNKLGADIPHALNAIRELTMLGEASYVRCAGSLVEATGRARCPGRVAGVALVAGVVASIGFGTSLAVAAPALSALRSDGPAAGTIFVANAGLIPRSTGGTGPGSITAYRPGATGDARPEIVITKDIHGPGGLAVDSSGDLWVANEVGSVVEYSRADLAQPSPAPTVTIAYVAGGLAFDPSGDLWAINGTDVAEFTKAEIAKSGSPKPVFSLPDNCSVVFDSSGDLWEGSSDDWVLEFTRAQLVQLAKSTSQSPTPDVMIASDSLNGPCKPAFDAAGGLWAGNYGGGTVVEFTKAQLAKSGSPAPKVTLSSLAIGVAGDVAIDRSGDLWVPDAVNNAVNGFTESQLTKSGSQPPVFNIAGSATGLNWPWAVAIEG
jgi:hypothetical protein